MNWGTCRIWSVFLHTHSRRFYCNTEDVDTQVRRTGKSWKRKDGSLLCAILPFNTPIQTRTRNRKMLYDENVYVKSMAILTMILMLAEYLV